MAVKFEFGKAPETFAHTVKFKMLDGSESELKVVYKYRSRKACAALIDEMTSAARARGLSEKPDLTMTEVMEALSGDNAKYLLLALKSWDLQDELNEQNAARLMDEYPMVANAIMEQYRAACLDGRLGN